MVHYRISTLREVLRSAAKGTLEQAWIYLRESGNVQVNSECLVLREVEEQREYAASLGFPQEGLDTASIEDCGSWAEDLQQDPSDELFFYVFRYYWLFDAFPGKAFAPDPPPPNDTNHSLALNFYRDLGDERSDVKCQHEGCMNGAIEYSVLCRRHHYEMIRKEPCPFDGDV